MHGQIHDCLKRMILEQYDWETWCNIVNLCGCDEAKHFLKLQHYPDNMTIDLFKTTSQVLGLSFDTTCEAYGKYFMKYSLDTGYASMLRALGPSVRAFIQNLDNVHTLLSVCYKNIVPPIFRPETSSDGHIFLHYYSYRLIGLHYLAIGIIKGAAYHLYNKEDLQVDVVTVDRYTVSDTEVLHHAKFKVYLDDGGQNDQVHSLPKEMLEKMRQGCPFSPKTPQQNNSMAKTFPNGTQHDLHKDIENINSTKHVNGLNEVSEFHQINCPHQSSSLNTIPTELLVTLVPYHIVFDSQLQIVQCGKMLQGFCPHVTRGASMKDVCKIEHPRLPFTFSGIVDFMASSFTLKMFCGKEMILKGQMMVLSPEHLIFMCSAKLTTLSEMLNKKVFISDLAIYDMTREFVLLNQLRHAEIDISQKREEMTAKLQIMSDALVKEKEKTEMLLHQMLPEKVATTLRNNKQVVAEKFDEATVLFSDIVSFTNIAAAVTPMQIVDMLNLLYSYFDQLTTVHNVYKVETIGDAYMVVAGVPEVKSQHAESMANFALDLMLEASRVPAPDTKQPLMIRVGMHSGSVVAGVVGKKMPRYCLFGDTVNVAARMEHHGVSGKIHLSEQTYRKLEESKFNLTKRGNIHIKGKGRMATYFLNNKGPKTSTSLSISSEYTHTESDEMVTPESSTCHIL